MKVDKIDTRLKPNHFLRNLLIAVIVVILLVKLLKKGKGDISLMTKIITALKGVKMVKSWMNDKIERWLYFISIKLEYWVLILFWDLPNLHFYTITFSLLCHCLILPRITCMYSNNKDTLDDKEYEDRSAKIIDHLAIFLYFCKHFWNLLIKAKLQKEITQ